MHSVERWLVAGVGVDRGHEAFVDADEIIQNFCDRREAVRRARGIRDDQVILRQLVMIDTKDDGEIGVFARRGNQHALSASSEMGRRFVLGSEDAGAFECDIDAHCFMGKLGRVLDGRHFDGTAADVDCVARNSDGVGETAVHAVETQEVSICLDGAEVVDRNDFDILPATFENRAQHVAANPAKTVDRDLNSHIVSSGG